MPVAAHGGRASEGSRPRAPRSSGSFRIDDVTGVAVRPAPDVNQRSAQRALWAIMAAGVVAGLLRVPFVFTGLSTDEGGYAYVAQQWSRGARIYGTAWLDRPQGLLLTYRGLLALNDSGWTIRLGMVLAGVAITVLVAMIARLVAGRRAAVV